MGVNSEELKSRLQARIPVEARVERSYVGRCESLPSAPALSSDSAAL